ncbi:MAG: GNAT family N-acetyltransferase [Proteobacteria bacterium]|nr:GNAT family N-acetyltransferase [Pseudomonadota bacterium]MBI3499044.1 GNAT family N-acetyltransferase [Pseudomonadota bacterium]
MSAVTDPAIVAAIQSDTATLAWLQGQCFDDPWGRVGFGRMLSLPGAFALICRTTLQRGRVSVGFAVCQVVGEQAELLTLGVLPERRREGHARRLLAESCARARQRGAGHMFLEVAEDNLPGQVLYKSFGFVVVGRRPGYYRDQMGRRVAALTMRRDIEPDHRP